LPAGLFVRSKPNLWRDLRHYSPTTRGDKER
jgi:hypothetical protein